MGEGAFADEGAVPVPSVYAATGHHPLLLVVVQTEAVVVDGAADGDAAEDLWESWEGGLEEGACMEGMVQEVGDEEGEGHASDHLVGEDTEAEVPDLVLALARDAAWVVGDHLGDDDVVALLLRIHGNWEYSEEMIVACGSAGREERVVRTSAAGGRHWGWVDEPSWHWRFLMMASVLAE